MTDGVFRLAMPGDVVDVENQSDISIRIMCASEGEDFPLRLWCEILPSQATVPPAQCVQFVTSFSACFATRRLRACNIAHVKTPIRTH